LQRVGQAPDACKVLQLEAIPDPTRDHLYYFADAMVVAYALRLPTLHGFTGYKLADQDSRDPTKPDYEQGAARWWADHGISSGICALNPATGHWRIVQQ
jgi:hypothetical protein